MEKVVLTRVIEILTLFAAIGLTGCSTHGNLSDDQGLIVRGRSTIVGKVLLRGTGDPLRHILVSLCRDVRPAVGCTSELSRTRTGDDGTYVFRGVPAGDYVPAVRMSGKIYAANLSRAEDWPFREGVRYTARDSEVTRIPAILIADAPGGDEVRNLDQERVPLVSPDFGTCVGSRPELSWKPLDGASGYLPELLRIGGPQAGGIELGLGHETGKHFTGTRFRVPEALADGFYRWSVSAYGPNAEVLRSSREPSAAEEEGFFTVFHNGC